MRDDRDVETLSFSRNGLNAIPLGEVADRAFSEVMRELVPLQKKVRSTPAGDPKSAKSDFETIERVLEKVARSPELRADASRALEALGERAIHALQLIGSGRARDEATLATALGDPDEAHTLLTAIAKALRRAASKS